MAWLNLKDNIVLLLGQGYNLLSPSIFAAIFNAFLLRGKISTIIMTVGFFSLFMFHSTEFMVAINLTIVASGISLIQVGAFNITMEYTPRRFSGVSLGMSVVLVLIGSSIGPTIAGIYMQTHQEVIAKGVSGSGGSFPSPIPYNLIFLTGALISALSIMLVIFLRGRIRQSQSTLKLEMERSNISNRKKK